jgi:glc operon protein GlcG
MKAKLLTLVITLISYCAVAQTPASPIVPYGEPITLESAKKILNAAHAFAMSKQWTVVIAIVDTGGNLVLLEKFDNTQIGSIDVAIGKAKTANNFKRPTKAYEDGIITGGAGLRVLNVPGITPVEGGEPILSNGKIIGGIGVSGMKSTEDSEVVKAGLAALK